jgi:lipoate-protein ligase A
VRVRFLDTGPADPAWNMAVDDVLLRSAGGDSAPVSTLRVYGWRPAAVSVGRFQDLVAEPLPTPLRELPHVRRITGGGAVLHRDELTFAIAATLGDLGAAAGPGRLRAIVSAALRGVLRGLGELGIEARIRSAPRLRGAQPALCFQRDGGCVIETEAGERLVGSAQRRSGAAVLLHGSLPLGAQPNAGGTTTATRVARRPVRFEEAASALSRGIAHAFGWELAPSGLTDAEAALAGQLAASSYAAFTSRPARTQRRAAHPSPVAAALLDAAGGST